MNQIPRNNNPQILVELFSIYREWQDSKAQDITNRQEDIENKIEVADALASKLLQRFNHSVSAMRTTSHHLSQVNGLQVELGELKGRLTEVINNCDTLCKRINAEGPQSLRSTVTPFTLAPPDSYFIKPNLFLLPSPDLLHCLPNLLLRYDVVVAPETGVKCSYRRNSMFGIRSRSYKHLGSQIWYETIWSKEQLE
ncbi:BnaA05g20280D [Brassica napus]|uniref:BnaA05g20280D protein n=1 Tax=Brassica napus TaxID=3708 RepID=A0A078FZ49_BRANA|nr:BnaA05g20280D [Brassica napus]